MRRIRVLSALIVGTVVASAAPARAQAEPPRRVEIGGGLDTIFSLPIDGGGHAQPTANMRVTASLTRRFAVEGFVEAGRAHESTQGFYGFQVKQRLLHASSPTREVFLTYGVAGWYTHHGAEEYHYTGRNGPEVYRAPAYTNVKEPILPFVGGGVQKRVANRLAVRAEGQLVTWQLFMPIFVRASAGVSIPIGPSSGY